MNYILKNPEYTDALSDVGKYPFVLLYKYSEIKLCHTDEVLDEDWAECMEARVFSDQVELHLFPQEQKAILVSDRQDDDEDAKGQGCIQTEYYLDKAFRFGEFTRVKIRQYIEADEDGQMRVTLTRLAGLA